MEKFIEHTMQTYFAKGLKLHLKKYIKGHINSHIVNDTLIVDIYGVNSLVYRYTLENMSSEIVQGLTSETCCKFIVKQYRGYINNLYFL